MLWLLLMCLGLGAVVGLLAGLLGIGGGLLIVPALVWLLPRAGIAPELVMHIALATSLACIVLTSGSSARSHLRLGNVDITLVKLLAPGMILGGFAGSAVAEWVPAEWLPRIFAAIVLLLALQMLLSLKVSGRHPLPGSVSVAGSGSVIGLIASLAGIGGGSLTVPYLSWYGVEMRRAIGTAAFCGSIIAVAGMIGFMIAGSGDEALPPYSIGYVYLPALLGVVCTSVVTTRYGARLVSNLPTQTLKKIFAIFLLFIGGRMLF
ncbi:sulfite exporter TauE/SafE family protein [Photobacterium sp. 1_MG-2023]|uniref:sulfite exporter TauE/SafE family protein n=1 Tax=Photobacterium sp. 1_MG-2023 TaxID=3062646 RepID=UPI0026E41210|nr:sulfite exporter TauE/SafE family protein [Photobacterium sp. 1_MG-2023]